MEKKPPIKKPPLPLSGEAARSILEERWEKSAILFVLTPGFLLFAAGIEWCHRLFALPVNPWFWTVLFFLSLPFSVLLYRRSLKELKHRVQGYKGELVVGQALENLRSLGCRVYHDISEDGYNIDHVVIAPNGLFSIETKAPSKPSKGQCEVVFDGKTVTITGGMADEEPVIQAKSAARRVHEIIRDTSAENHRVIPVLLYVDWFVRSTSFNRDIHVMNQDYFLKAFENLGERELLPSKTVDFLAKGMERYLREKKK
jgi:hypothetical protein